MNIYRVTSMVSGEVHEGTSAEIAEMVGRSKNTVMDTARAGGILADIWNVVNLGECENLPDHVERLGLRRECPGCGKEFVAKSFRQWWCSTACVRRSYKKVHPEKFNKPKAEPKMEPKSVVEKPNLSLDEIRKLAWEAGMSYGIYVALNGL